MIEEILFLYMVIIDTEQACMFIILKFAPVIRVTTLVIYIMHITYGCKYIFNQLALTLQIIKVIYITHNDIFTVHSAC